MKNFWRNFNDIDLIFGICLLMFGAVSVYMVFSSTFVLCDTIEHLRASLAVALGMKPYVDFFEHHHPLLWYVLSPLVKRFYLDVNILYILRIVSVLVRWGIIYLVYKISEDLYGKRTAKFATLFLISVPYLWVVMATLQPDIFMLFCFLAGLRFFLAYLDRPKLQYLMISYLLMVISFMFLQKAVFMLVVFGGFNLYCLYKKLISIRDFVWAASIAILPMLMALGFLFYKGMLTNFIYYNYIFNTHVREYYGFYQDYNGVVLNVIMLFLAMVVIRVYKFSLKSSVIFWCFLLQLLFMWYFSPYVQYSTAGFVFAAILVGEVLSRKKVSVVMLLIVFILSVIFLCPTDEERKGFNKYMQTAKLIVTQNMHDEMLDLSITQVNIFGAIKNFYWFGFQNAVVIDQLYHFDDNFDLFELIKSQKPKYLILPAKDLIVMWHQKWFGYRNRLLLRKMQHYPKLKSRLIGISSDYWQIDEDWVEKNYTKDANIQIYRRKDEVK